jgi:hypothetical protein
MSACTDARPGESTSAPAAKPEAEIPAKPPQSQQPAALPNSALVPAGFTELWKQAASAGEAGRQGDYSYQYAGQGDRAVAIMTPRSIPRDDTILVATIADLFPRAFTYGDISKMALPRLEPTLDGNAIMFESRAHRYYVLTIKNETREGLYGAGEPHTLLVWRKRTR